MSPESLAIKLRQARGAMSLAEAAEQSEIPEERIRMYEEGARRPYALPTYTACGWRSLWEGGAGG
jgi:hypothetical protein